MNESKKTKILAEAIRIGDQLLDARQRDEHGLYWPNLELDHSDPDREGPSRFHWGKSPTLYSGGAGISQFLLELGRISGEERFTAAAREGIDWCIAHALAQERRGYALITGYLGLALTLIRFAQRLEDSSYLQKALAVAEPCLDFLENPIDDFINGRSGTLLGLLHLHSATGEPELLAKADQFTEALLASACAGPAGYYWDRSQEHIIGLCGLSHGAAGIGFVFSELAYYTGNTAYDWLADQAFVYEQHHYRPDWQNWPDLRCNTYSAEDKNRAKEAYLAGNKEFFTTGTNFNAWCHGAAGIGLSRLWAYHRTQNASYLEQAQAAIATTVKTNVEAGPEGAFNYSLCHGGGGNADLLIEAYLHLGDPRYLELAAKVADYALQQREERGLYICGFPRAENPMEDNSLFMGISGVGYFYLRLLDPENVPSVEAPALSQSDPHSSDYSPYSRLSFTLPQLRARMVEQNFPRTSKILSQIDSNHLAEHFAHSGHPSEPRRFVEFVQKMLSTNPEPHLVELFGFENQKFDLEQSVESAGYLATQERLHAEWAKPWIESETIPEKFETLRLQSHRDIITMETQWNWTQADTDTLAAELVKPPEQAEGQSMLLKPTSLGVAETALPEFSQVILHAFSEPRSIAEGIEEIYEAFDNPSEADKEQIRQAALKQIREALVVDLLVVALD